MDPRGPPDYYNLFAKLKDVEKKGVGNMLVSAARVGKIDVFSDEGVNPIEPGLFRAP